MKRKTYRIVWNDPPDRFRDPRPENGEAPAAGQTVPAETFPSDSPQRAARTGAADPSPARFLSRPDFEAPAAGNAVAHSPSTESLPEDPSRAPERETAETVPANDSPDAAPFILPENGYPEEPAPARSRTYFAADPLSRSGAWNDTTPDSGTLRDPSVPAADIPTRGQIDEMIDRRLASLRVYVLESDITDTQQAVRAVVRQASF